MRKTMILAVSAVLLVSIAAWAAGEVMSIQVRNGALRSRPSFLGKVTTEVPYGTQVTIKANRGPWIQVTDPFGMTGWIHDSALTERELELVAGNVAAETGASNDEIALAGKGFNSQVEEAYKDGQSGDGFMWVDHMESITISPENAIAFLEAGQVISNTEGGQ
jgi:hypothetical protein